MKELRPISSVGISIHAPREGGDGAAAGDHRCHCISIHAHREGGDFFYLISRMHQSLDFNPRPPRGGRLIFDNEIESTDIISIHAPREGGDRNC